MASAILGIKNQIFDFFKYLWAVLYRTLLLMRTNRTFSFGLVLRDILKKSTPPPKKNQNKTTKKNKKQNKTKSNPPQKNKKKTIEFLLRDQDITQNHFLSGVYLIWIKIFPFSCCLTKVKEPSLLYYLPIAKRRREEMDSCLYQSEVKRKQPRSEFKLRSLTSFLWWPLLRYVLTHVWFNVVISPWDFTPLTDSVE